MDNLSLIGDELSDVQIKVKSLSFNWFIYQLEALDPERKSTNGSMGAIEDEVDRITQLLRKGASLRSRISKRQRHFSKTLAEHQDVLASDASVAKLAQGITESYKAAGGALDTLLARLGSDTLKKQLRALYSLQKGATEYTSMPIQYTGGKAVIDYTITPRSEEYLLPTYRSRLTFPLRSNRVIGVGALFFGSSLNNNAFSSLETPITDSTSEFRLVREKKQGLELGVASVLQVGYRWPNNLGLSLGFGPGVTFAAEPQFRFLTGIGILFGRKHNFTLQGGWIMGPTDRLSAAYSLDQVYAKQPEQVTTPVVNHKFFVSLGYFFQQ